MQVSEDDCLPPGCSYGQKHQYKISRIITQKSQLDSPIDLFHNPTGIPFIQQINIHIAYSCEYPRSASTCLHEKPSLLRSTNESINKMAHLGTHC